MTDNNDLKGLRGWLILVGIGVVIAPIRLALELMPLYYDIFTNGSFEVLTTPGSNAYHPMWAPLIMFETVFNSLIILASCYLIYLYFSKHYLFPKVYIAIISLTLIFIPFDAWLLSYVMPDEPIFDAETTKQFVRTLVGAVIWVPYMLISQRVKATFVEKRPNDASQQDTKSPATSA